MMETRHQTCSAIMMTKVIINTINQDEEYSSEWSEESDDSENDG